MENNIVDMKNLDTNLLLNLFANSIAELKSREVFRTKNLIGELGEHLAIKYFNKTSELPNLTATPVGHNHYDATSEDGKRYSIKTVTGSTTGTFQSIELDEEEEKSEPQFDYVLVVVLKDYELYRINQLTWEQFLLCKGWHSRMKAYNLRLTKKLYKNSTTVFYLPGKPCERIKITKPKSATKTLGIGERFQIELAVRLDNGEEICGKDILSDISYHEKDTDYLEIKDGYVEFKEGIAVRTVAEVILGCYGKKSRNLKFVLSNRQINKQK
ncbi:hypothetical protein BAQ49_25300 [Bacillus proteolyticus]|uniref:Uncharacterized protein n=1 Tax=Bacillus proteolyticus TaxID=2026192 RepID=A0AA44R8H4_9BACI|nr:hypothetical protein BAQ49_25300 [Bacillus proteolyticus]